MIRKETICLLIDITISGDSNLNTKETGKLSSYGDRENEVSRMWEISTKFVPVVIGALGTIKKGLDRKLQLLPGQQSAMELPKITLMSTANIIRKVPG